MKTNRLPKKLKLSSVLADGSLKELGTIEQDGDKWFISGKHKEGIKSIIGKRGKYFGGKLCTIRDRELCIPLMMGYTYLVTEIIEYEQEENNDNKN